MSRGVVGQRSRWQVPLLLYLLYETSLECGVIDNGGKVESRALRQVSRVLVQIAALLNVFSSQELGED
jgi:hypothetical protein